jgi:hypothetical protein
MSMKWLSRDEAIPCRVEHRQAAGVVEPEVVDQFDCGERSRQIHPTNQIAPASIKAVVEIKGTPSSALDT